MLTSEHRILTTHTGSLPRPAALTELYARRAAGESVDEAAIDTAGKTATRHVVRQQIAAGIDIGNNGEQQREAFFLYVRHRMTGFGGTWTRRSVADVTKYPGFAAMSAEAEGARRSVSNRGTLPSANGPVEYIDPALVDAECAEEILVVCGNWGFRGEQTVEQARVFVGDENINMVAGAGASADSSERAV